MLVKILGLIDFAASLAFLLLLFTETVFVSYWIFCAGLIFVKSLFLLKGDVLSFIDLISAVILIFSIFITLPSIIIWLIVFLLITKGVASLI